MNPREKAVCPPRSCGSSVNPPGLLAILSKTRLRSFPPAKTPREPTVKHRAIKRRNVVIGIGATAGAAAVGGIALNASASTGNVSGSSDGSLVFDPDAYTKLTTTVTDAKGTEHAVTYHFWKAITYVSKPVDATYQ